MQIRLCFILNITVLIIIMQRCITEYFVGRIRVFKSSARESRGINVSLLVCCTQNAYTSTSYAAHCMLFSNEHMKLCAAYNRPTLNNQRNAITFLLCQEINNSQHNCHHIGQCRLYCSVGPVIQYLTSSPVLIRLFFVKFRSSYCPILVCNI